MSKPKILLLDQYSQIGGGQRIFVDLAQIFKRANFDLTLAYPHGGELEALIDEKFGNLLAQVEIKSPYLNAGAKTLKDFWSMLIYFFYFLRFRSLLQRHDYVYVNGSRLFLPVWFLSFFVKAKFIYHVHLNHSLLEKTFIRLIESAPHTAYLIVNSNFVYRELVKFDSIFEASPRVVLIENTLSETFSDLPFINRFNDEQTDPMYIAVIGRVSPEKGQAILLKIAPLFPNTAFFVIGDSDFTDAQYLNELKRAEISNIIFAGKVSDIKEAIDELRIQVSLVPSTWDEPFGLVAIESMANSCLTIVSAKGELPHIAQETGAMVYETEENLTMMIESLLQTPRSKLKEQAYLQHYKTIEHYHYRRFEAMILSLFKLANSSD
ncbi:MAG: glycosyltransferase family 4 protein [Candidatus Caenarcaniphilales bacterium]|nr:glycosyltransferase family 4 protein [Candidatus Caenarcaniphilales bacterium]